MQAWPDNLDTGVWADGYKSGRWTQKHGSERPLSTEEEAQF